MTESRHFGNIYISLSPDQKYLCSTDSETSLVSLWDIKSKTLFTEIWLPENGIRTHTWSSNSTLLFVFGFNSGVVYSFSTLQGFVMVENFTGTTNQVIDSFYNYETD